MEKSPKTEKPKTTKARSPGYPAIGLKEAVEKVTAIYEKDYQAPTSREVAVEHMGYNGLNGKSLTVLSSLSKYGLLEGRGDNSRVSDLAVTIIAHPTGTPERAAALREAASKPELFSELDTRFQNGKVSDQAIRSYLMTQKFIPAAADTAIRAYRETKELVSSETNGYNEPETNQGTGGAQTNDKPANKPIEIGDLVQVEIGGVLQLEKAARVRGFQDHEGTKWAFVENSETGIPMEQLILVEKSKPAAIQPPTLGLASEILGIDWREERLLDDTGEEIFIRYKGEPTKDRYQFIHDYLDFKLKRIK